MDEAPNPFMVITVKNKKTGETEKIKESRFNPGLHIFLKDREVNYSGGRAVNVPDQLPIIGQSPTPVVPAPIVEPVNIPVEPLVIPPPESIVTSVDAPVEPEEKTEEDVRALAKEKGIKSWHIKSIERLKEELSAL